MHTRIKLKSRNSDVITSSITCISIGVKGVRGVPGKLLPIDDGVLGIDPAKLRGGLKSDEGVGGVDLTGDPAP